MCTSCRSWDTLSISDDLLDRALFDYSLLIFLLFCFDFIIYLLWLFWGQSYKFNSLLTLSSYFDFWNPCTYCYDCKGDLSCKNPVLPGWWSGLAWLQTNLNTICIFNQQNLTVERSQDKIVCVKGIYRKSYVKHSWNLSLSQFLSNICVTRSY